VKRKRLTKARRAEILSNQGGLCVVWGCTETRGLIEEHSTPFTWTGELPDQLMCEAHHKEKTRLDIGKIAKVKRIRKKAAGETKQKRPIKSRGFDKTKTKGFDGKVRDRG